MVLERIVDFISSDDDYDPSHVRGRTHTKVCFNVHEVTNVKGQAQNSKANMWYTIKPQVDGNSKKMAMGKLSSKSIACRDGHFNSQHEILVDTGMVHGLVLKVKTHSAILRRKVTVGSYTLKVSSSSNSAIDEVVTLTNKKGETVGNVHISVNITRTVLPALHFAPQPFWKPSPNVLTRPYTSLSREGSDDFGEERHLVSCRQGTAGSIKVQGDNKRFMAKQSGLNWKISEKSVPSAARAWVAAAGCKLWLECTPAPKAQKGEQAAARPMKFTLQDNSGGSSSLALVAGNAADPSAKEAAWGTYTLVRQFRQADSKQPQKDEFLALVNLAGPVVETWSVKEVPLALALANAMFWSSMLHAPAQLEVHQRIQAAFTRKSASSSWGWGAGAGAFEHGRGFFVLGSDAAAADVTELRAKLSGVGANIQTEEQCVAAFLRNANSLCHEGLVISGVMVAKELDWRGGTLLGLPFF